MTVVLLHGNPETPVIWEPLVAELGRTDVVTPQLPGFGCAVPEGFGATKDEYVAWFLGEIEPIAAEHGPVDFVGHDWGGLIGMRAVSLRPELFRTWACDVLGTLHPDYVWHDFAKIWQTPGAGEEYFANSQASSVEERVALLETIGIPRTTGEQLVAVSDDVMSASILALYRSAPESELKLWGEALGPVGTLPGLAIIAPNDPFVRAEDLGGEIADRLGATRQVMDGQGHWWMLGDPVSGAAALTKFWAEAY